MIEREIWEPSLRTAPPPSAALARKLSKVIDLSREDQAALDLLGWNSRKVAPHCDLIGDGDRPVNVQLILAGWACRYKMLPDGSRQITAILMPGDFCDLHITVLDTMDHAIAALSPVVVAQVSRRQLDTAIAGRPDVALGFDWITMVDIATLRAWMTSLGQTSALSRVAHLVCELHQRTINIGAADGDTFPCWMSQLDIADATGQTPVHVNRVISQLRKEGLATITRRSITIHDVERLKHVGNFNPAYLHAQALTHR
jgi:CRP-like cAMP-binding protein